MTLSPSKGITTPAKVTRHDLTSSRMQDMTNRTHNTTAAIEESFEQAHLIAMKRRCQIVEHTMFVVFEIAAFHSAAAAIAKCEAMHEQLELEKRIASEDRLQLTSELKKNQQRAATLRAALETELKSEKAKNLELQEKLALLQNDGKGNEQLEADLADTKKQLQAALAKLEVERQHGNDLSSEQMELLQQISILEEAVGSLENEALSAKTEILSKCNLLEHQVVDLRAENDNLRQMMKAFTDHEEFLSFISEGDPSFHFLSGKFFVRFQIKVAATTPQIMRPILKRSCFNRDS